MTITVLHGDMLAELPKLDANSLDACVCDPPYHLTTGKRGGSGEASVNPNSPAGRSMISTGFMGKAWDGGDIAFRVETWTEVMRVLKPGAYLLAFGGTRTFHRMACAIEDAGFEVRDTLCWVYGSGFPKSLDVSKAIDKAAGAERSRYERAAFGGTFSDDAGTTYGTAIGTDPITPEAAQWSGWGTALKPSHEDIVMAQKPYTISQNIAIIGSEISRLERKLWSMLPANVAVDYSGLSQSEYVEALNSVPWSADERSNTRDALCAQMDTSRFVSATISSLSTVSSWKAFLADASTPESTFTTEMDTRATIDLKTWKSCLSAITPKNIIQAHSQGSGLNANAESAVRYLCAIVSKWNATRELSALEHALSSDATNSPAEVGSLRPKHSPIIMARKPLGEKTVAANVLRHGVGAINVDACRVEGVKPVMERTSTIVAANAMAGTSTGARSTGETTTLGRWPANVVHDGSEEVLAGFPETVSVGHHPKQRGGAGMWSGEGGGLNGNSGPEKLMDTGSAARFFYTSKADASDRLQSKHPTVKPVDLIRWLVRMVTPPGGTVLDCFAGSGTTGMAAMAEGFNAILIEREAEYVADIRRRLAHVQGSDTPLFAETSGNRVENENGKREVVDIFSDFPTTTSRSPK